ncbi:MAG: tRNA uridine(34) 5-carboxymethylaminomethyl modification radical SAM/GNAT enzyme Elp3 [Anaerolineales bacterium]|nr:tRNA uridine(34) 5-carboxymethylaminomethyl modification radical SAM/GNAT enzyme Elp3 [Anaerolineales bacterium]
MFSDSQFHAQREAWWQARQYTPERMEAAYAALLDVRAGVSVFDAIKRHPLTGEGGGYVGKQFLIAAYNKAVELGELDPDPKLLARLRMKPMRTLSGVTTVTVLTKPYPCPGKCIFCPTDWRMPKSYLPDEPGARRALQHQFDPYTQVRDRLTALEAIGHPTDKIELLILGGTWSSYRRDYQEWFVLRCFQALNESSSDDFSRAEMIEIATTNASPEILPIPTNSDEFPSFQLPSPPDHGPLLSYHADLLAAQQFNETAQHRNVGLVIETRPDHVTPDELAWLRHLGVTKVQMGAQSFDDHILEINQRGHTVQETLDATAMLRAGGFKIVLHWMPNLHGATPDSDRKDFTRLWEGFCPDEIKIYPNQLLANAELYDVWLRGEFHPYETDELVHLIADVKTTIPRYCRVNRVIRDIPSTNVVDGNRRTSLRMDVHAELKRRGQKCECVRCREVGKERVNPDDLKFDDLTYPTAHAEEHFLSFVTPSDKLAGFLRLSLPARGAPPTGLRDLADAAIIREVHVYGQSLAVGDEQDGAAQHIGLGTELIAQAEEIARARGFARLAVIAAVGTRLYYEGRGFERGELYLVKPLTP